MERGGVNRDSSPLALARNQPFLCQMFTASRFGLEFSRCLKLFHFFVKPVFLVRFFANFLWFLSCYYLFGNQL